MRCSSCGVQSENRVREDDLQVKQGERVVSDKYDNPHLPQRTVRGQSPPPSSPPITIQVQVPGAADSDNDCLLPQQGASLITSGQVTFMIRLSFLLWRRGPQWGFQEDFQHGE